MHITVIDKAEIMEKSRGGDLSLVRSPTVIAQTVVEFCHNVQMTATENVQQRPPICEHQNV